jgi:hypothetical protein
MAFSSKPELRAFDTDGLGEQMMERKAQLLAQFKGNGLPTPVTRAFTGHKLKQGAPVESR